MNRRLPPIPPSSPFFPSPSLSPSPTSSSSLFSPLSRSLTRVALRPPPVPSSLIPDLGSLRRRSYNTEGEQGDPIHPSAFRSFPRESDRARVSFPCLTSRATVPTSTDPPLPPILAVPSSRPCPRRLVRPSTRSNAGSSSETVPAPALPRHVRRYSFHFSLAIHPLGGWKARARRDLLLMRLAFHTRALLRHGSHRLLSRPTLCILHPRFSIRSHSTRHIFQSDCLVSAIFQSSLPVPRDA